MVFLRIRGLPQARADYASAQICAVYANVHRSKDAKVFEPNDFIPQLIEADQEEDLTEEPQEEMIDIEATSNALMQMLGRKQE